MGDTGDPWGMLFWTGSIELQCPSMQMAASLSLRKLAVHLTYSRGRFFR